MSNYISANNGNKNLMQLFKPNTSGLYGPNSNYTQNNQDISQLFEKKLTSPTTVLPTGFSTNTLDLNQQFMDINYNGPISVTFNQGYYSLDTITFNNVLYQILTVKGTITNPNEYNGGQGSEVYVDILANINTTINFILIGGGAGGGAGATSDGSNNGGAAGGAGGGYAVGSFVFASGTTAKVNGGLGGLGGYYGGGQGGGQISAGGGGSNSKIEITNGPDIGKNIIVSAGTNNNGAGLYNGAPIGTNNWCSKTLGGNMISNTISATLSLSGNLFPGGNGGTGCNNNGDSADASGINASQISPIPYLGVSVYAGGGGGGATNKQTSIQPSPGGLPSGGVGGNFGNGGNAPITVSSIPAYGGGGGGASWGASTGDGGNGQAGVSILWWPY